MERLHISLITLLLSVSGVLSGCSGEVEHYSQSLEVQRNGWDTLAINVDFSSRSAFRTISVEPSKLDVTLFDSRYDTLYSGSDLIIPVVDKELGNRERLLIEVCGEIESIVLCEQRSIHASPKRVILDHEISYPEDWEYAAGSYAFNFIVQRQQFEGEEWENILRKRNVEGYVLAYVEDEQLTAIRVPFSRKNGNFDLKHHSQFKDFAYHIQSALYDGRDARIRFDVYAGLGEQKTKIASIQKFIHRKTEQDRREEVQYYVAQAVEEIIDRLSISSAVQVYVDDWYFDDPLKSYSVDIEVRWGSGFFSRHGFRGELRVQENGTDAQFHFERGDRRVDRLWRGRYGRDDIFLGHLGIKSGPDQQL